MKLKNKLKNKLNNKLNKKLVSLLLIIMVTLAASFFAACAEKKGEVAGTTGGGSSITDGGGGGQEESIEPCDPSPLAEANSGNFISKWDVSIAAGTTGLNKIKLPLITVGDGGKYNFIVDWGDCTAATAVNLRNITANSDDGEGTTITAPTSGSGVVTPLIVTHTYSPDAIRTNGNTTFTVAITTTTDVTGTGIIEGWRFGNGNADRSGTTSEGLSDAAKLTEISSFGPLDLGDTAGYQFYGAKNLTITATAGTPKLTGTTRLNYAFANAANFNGDLSEWTVTEVTDMTSMFESTTAFNNGADAGSAFKSDGTTANTLSWGVDVSKVTGMDSMFKNATAFNADISGWKIGKDVTGGNMINMRYMFNGAKVFDQPIGTWDVSKVNNMERMFSDAKVFNQDLSGWEGSSTLDKVKNMSYMFYKAEAFNNGAPAGSAFKTDATTPNTLTWNVTGVENMGKMFRNAKNFNADISGWTFSSTADIDMGYMFATATKFNNGGETLKVVSWNDAIARLLSGKCTNMFTGSAIETEIARQPTGLNGCQ